MPLSVAFLATLILGACSTSGATNTYGGTEGSEAVAVIGDRGLGRHLEMRHVRVRRNAEQRLHVQFELHNRRSSEVDFDWAMQWFDDSGFVLDLPKDWRPVALSGDAFEYVSVTAPLPAASQYKLALRAASRVR
jgi:uncharacterized protein YcfL